VPEETEKGDGAPIEVHLRDYLRVVRKHAGIATAFFLVVVAAVAVVTFRTAPVYRATATLSIERQWPPSFDFEDLVSPEKPQDEYRKTQQELIKSRPIVGAAYRKLHLDKIERFSDARDGVEAFRECIAVSPREGTYLVDVSIESENRKAVEKWVNVLVEEYVNYMDLRYRSTSREAEERITERIPELRGKLLESEASLREFLKQNHVVAFDKQLEILYQKLNTLEARRTATETELIRLEAGHQVLLAGGNGDSPPAHLPEIASSKVLEVLLRQEAVLVEAFAEVRAKLKPSHPRYRYAQEQIAGVQEKIREETGRIARDLKAQIETKKKEMERLGQLIANQRDTVSRLEEKSSRVAALRQEVDSNRRMYREFTERRKEIESAAKLGRTDVAVVERAREPKEPVRPKKALNLTLAAVVGLLGGVALAFFIEYLDDSLKSPEDAEGLDTPLIGVVPEISPSPGTGSRDLVCLDRPKAPPAEAFRAIRTALTFSRAGEDEARTYVVTSPGPVEGKTLNAVNIALTMARADQKILLIDADMRKPSLHELLGIDGNHPGLSEYFRGEAGFEEICVPGPIENLTVIPCGTIPPNPSELLGSPVFEAFLQEARDRFDRVLFDTPPAVAVTDALVLGSRVDAVIFVVRAERTGKRTASKNLDEFRRLGARLAGVVLNGFNARKAGYSRGSYSSYYYYYHHDRYGYGYGKDERRDEGDRTRPAQGH